MCPGRLEGNGVNKTIAGPHSYHLDEVDGDPVVIFDALRETGGGLYMRFRDEKGNVLRRRLLPNEPLKTDGGYTITPEPHNTEKSLPKIKDLTLAERFSLEYFETPNKVKAD